MAGHIGAGQLQQPDAPQKVDVGDDAVQGKGRGRIEDPGLDGIKAGLGRAHPAAGGEAVPDGLDQFCGHAAHAQPLVIDVEPAGSGIAQDADPDGAVDVHTGPETGAGLAELVFEDGAVLLDAHQAAMAGQHAMDGIVHRDVRPGAARLDVVLCPCAPGAPDQQTGHGHSCRHPFFQIGHNSFSLRSAPRQRLRDAHASSPKVEGRRPSLPAPYAAPARRGCGHGMRRGGASSPAAWQHRPGATVPRRP